MSSTICILPILAALSMADTTFLDPQRPWLSANDTQTMFINTYIPKPTISLWQQPSHCTECSYLTEKELASCASHNVNEVNKFLKEHTFDIQLQDVGNDAWYIASVLNILLQWNNLLAYETELHINNISYPAVHMEGYGFACLGFKNSNDIIVALETHNKDGVFISLADKERSGFDLLNHVMYLTNKLTSFDDTFECGYTDIIFPMVDINEQPDISWLLGMAKNDPIIPNRQWRITQALQQTKFQMNEKGAAAQSAAAIAMTEKCNHCVPPRIFTVDKPFYLWIKRPGMNLPIFAAYIDESSWKKPQKLGI